MSIRKPRLRHLPVLIAFAFAGVLVGSPTAASGAVPRAGDSDRTAAQVVDYWTQKRMKKAEPLDVIEVDSGGGDPVPQAGPTIPFTSFELTDTLSFPNRVHGRVFFTDQTTGVNYSCSGTAVDSPNSATVVTAGHCVFHGGAWSANFSFVPGYQNGSSPYGVWAASDESAPTGWTQSGSFRYDVGVAVIARNSSGQLLEDVIGSRGILFNQPVSGSVRSHGYPAASPFNGSKLWACDSTLGYTDPNYPGYPTIPGAPTTMGIGCDMTGGSSGGGWVITDLSGNGYLNSVNSYKYTGQPNVMYGPYFGSSAESVYTALSNEEPGLPGTPSSGGGSTAPLPAASPLPASSHRVVCVKKRKKHSNKKKRVCKQV